MADPIALPPLPEPAFSLRWERGEYKVSPPMDDCDCYTADQLRARDIEVARLVLEAAADLVDDNAAYCSGQTASILGSNADAIRKMEVRHHE